MTLEYRFGERREVIELAADTAFVGLSRRSPDGSSVTFVFSGVSDDVLPFFPGMTCRREDRELPDGATLLIDLYSSSDPSFARIWSAFPGLEVVRLETTVGEEILLRN